MADPDPVSASVTVDVVDWLSSGARSGLVRVRGTQPEGAPAALPVLVLDSGGQVQRFTSLPDPSGERDPSRWRGAYVVDVAVAAAAAGWALEWPDGRRAVLQPPNVPVPSAGGPAADPAADPGPAPGGEVVDRAVLAERRARRAEAAEQAQARIAREALRAVEVLEQRAAEVEERLSLAQAERDVLRERLAEAPPPQREAVAEPALREQVAVLQAELERLREAPSAQAGPTAEDAERRADRLRDALTATVATVAELRLQLHEAQVSRRTREVRWSAEAVRLRVLEREHETVLATLDGLRRELDDVREAARTAASALDEARAAAAGAEAAHAETRRHFTERVAELRTARERIAELEAEVAEARARAERATAGAAETARAAAAKEAEALAGAAVARVAEAQEHARGLEARLEAAEAAVAEAQTARAIAEARAFAAAAERRAASVARAAASGPVTPAPPPTLPATDPFAAAAERLRGLPPAPEPAPRPGRASAAALSSVTERPIEPPGPVQAPPVPPADEPLNTAPSFAPAPPPAPAEVVAAAAEQVRAAAERAAPADPAERERVIADLSAAADALRRRATIVSAPGEPPGGLVRGRAVREYPPLRGALVKLAHDDPVAAGRIIAGLLPAQHRLIRARLDYDLTITELGTFAVSVGAGGTAVSLVPGGRGRRKAAFHLRADALTLAEMLAGVGPRPRRLGGRARISGNARRARVLRALADPGFPLDAAVRAGAALEPAVAVRCLAYVVHPSWTRGHGFRVELRAGDAGACITVLDGQGLSVTADGGGCEGDARVTFTPTSFAALLADDPGQPPPLVEGDATAVQQLLRWFDRARGRGTAA